MSGQIPEATLLGCRSHEGLWGAEARPRLLLENGRVRSEKADPASKEEQE